MIYVVEEVMLTNIIFVAQYTFHDYLLIFIIQYGNRKTTVLTMADLHFNMTSQKEKSIKEDKENPTESLTKEGLAYYSKYGKLPITISSLES